MSELLTADEAAAILHVARSTLYDWRYKGEGPKAFKIGTSARSKLLYRRVDVEAYLAERQRESR